MTTGFKNDGLLVREFIWDFAVDGGSGTVSLSTLQGELPLGVVVTGATVYVKTACAGSGTASVGLGGDVDGLLLATGYGSLDVDDALAGDGALVAAAGAVKYVNNTSNATVTITFGGGTFTAGKIMILVHYVAPSQVNA